MIKFHYAEWKNFLATGNASIRIDLDKYPSTLFVGKNGSGKSTLLDALCFGLFGKPFRNINKPTIVNTINGKECLVTVCFSVGSKRYKIVRGIKPNIFEIWIDDALMDQDSAAVDAQEFLEKTVLKMNYKSFTQIVILGSSSFVPFMQLKAQDRRDIIEDLLDIKIFSAMNNVLKQKQSDMKGDMEKLKADITATNNDISHTERLINEIKSHTQSQIDDYIKEIDDTRSSIEDMNKELASITKNLAGLQTSIADHPKVKNKLDTLTVLFKQISDRQKKEEKFKSFYDENNECPTCTQPIDVAIKAEKQDAATNAIEECIGALAEIEREEKKVLDRLNEIAAVNASIKEENEKIIRLNTKIGESQKHVAKLQANIVALQTQPQRLKDENANLSNYLTSSADQKAKMEGMITEKHYLDIAGMLLKDTGIKTKVIKQYLPVMNTLVNKYLASMDFFVNFQLDENFSESFKARYRDELSYYNFSEGQKQKINLALLFAWRDISKLKNSSSTNLLILDETFDSSLDFDGTEALFKILNTLGGTNVFIITPKKDLMADKFAHSVEFKLVNDFTKMVAQK